jgi:hypothetical protein
VPILASLRSKPALRGSGLAAGLGHVQGNCGANERLQVLFVNAVAFVKNDGTSDLAAEAGVGDELVLSEHTAKTHVAHILNKLDLRDRVQAVVRAYESGIVRAGE